MPLKKGFCLFMKEIINKVYRAVIHFFKCLFCCPSSKEPQHLSSTTTVSFKLEDLSRSSKKEREIVQLQPKITSPVHKKPITHTSASLKPRQSVTPLSFTSLHKKKEQQLSQSSNKERAVLTLEKKAIPPANKDPIKEASAPLKPPHNPVKEASSQNSSRLQSLDADAAGHLFSFLDPRDLISVGKTCKKLNEIANKKHLWQALIRKKFKRETNENDDKAMFQKLALYQRIEIYVRKVAGRDPKLFSLAPAWRQDNDYYHSSCSDDMTIPILKTLTKIKDLKRKISKLTDIPENQMGLLMKSHAGGTCFYKFTNIENNEFDEETVVSFLEKFEEGTKVSLLPPEMAFNIGVYHLKTGKK